MKKFPQVGSIIHRTPWAIEPAALKTIADIYANHVNGGTIRAVAPDDGEETPSCGYSTTMGVAVIDVMGPIIPRANLMSNISGACSSGGIAKAVKEALSDDAVEAILLNIDSPGGSVLGGFECADVIASARGKKATIACIDGMGCSLAYLFASQCDSIYCSRGSIVGSIGVISMRQSEDRAMKNIGVDSIVVSSSPAKGGVGMTEGDEMRQMQAEVDKFFGMFKDAIARGRPQLDLSGFDPGKTFIGSDALEMGLVDGIETVESTLSTMVG